MSIVATPSGIGVREAFVSLADLFCYPDASLSRRLGGALEAMNGLDVAATRSLEAFTAAVTALDPDEVQSLYTSTFDLAPSCNPYLGAHVFGEENRERARFMVGLRQRYAEAGREDPRELPDHIAVVLAFSREFREDEWSDLGRLVLVPALAKMDELLRATSNPYRHLVAATRQLAEFAIREGGQS